MLPPATALVITWRSSLAKRSGTGRTFLGPSAAGLLDADGTIQTASLNILRAGADAFASSQGTGGAWTYGIWSKKDQVLHPLQSAVIRDRFAVLRSRRD